MHVIPSDTVPSSEAPLSSRAMRLLAVRAKLDRAWMLHPEKLDPNRHCREKERVARTLELLKKWKLLEGGKSVELGCGEGTLARALRDEGSTVHAVDASANALKLFYARGSEGITLAIETLPDTKLAQNTFDLVICSEVIAEIDSRDHRLLMSEMARIVKPDGIVLFSSAVDLDSEDAVERLMRLFGTEFNIIDGSFSHHRLHIRLSKWWKALKQQPQTMLWLEKVSRSLWQEAAISHLILLGRRKQL